MGKATWLGRRCCQAPVRGAVKALREKYNLPITYEGPMYTCPCDLVDMTRMREKTGPKIIVPRARSISNILRLTTNRRKKLPLCSNGL